MWWKIIITVATLVALQHILRILYIMGFHKQVYRHYPGPCRIVPGIDSGAENIALLSNGLALITSGINPVHMGFILDEKILAHRGTLFLFDFNHPENSAIELKFTGKAFDLSRFSPHGISAYEDHKSGAVTIFAVNHRSDVEVVEVFQFEQKTLTLNHRKSITDPLMRSVNDVVAVSPETFYLTNDGHATSFIGRNLETFLQLTKGNVCYYDGNELRVVVDKGFGDNGITASPDYKFVYVAQPFNMRVNVFERNTDSSLKLVQEVYLGTSPDDIFVEPGNGNLWIGCQPTLHTLLDHLKDVSVISPSQVIHVKWEDSSRLTHTYSVSEVFQDPGDFLTASTIATYHQKTKGLLIGTTTDNMAYCRVDAF
ncbi:serum paraoxonase/arylesterase 2-like [Amphiura filiformis]|uniref:serum paraoxonase/arylesterase 2-like n=1 Tax=Amphiura filiformis TaxID=82378 RepID=UPI003B21D837